MKKWEKQTFEFLRKQKINDLINLLERKKDNKNVNWIIEKAIVENLPS